jgi:hypothetical protein
MKGIAFQPITQSSLRYIFSLFRSKRNMNIFTVLQNLLNVRLLTSVHWREVTLILFVWSYLIAKFI